MWNGYLLRRSGPRFSKCTLYETDIFYVDWTIVFLSVRCVIVDLLESLYGLCVPVCTYVYRVSQEECAILWESFPYVKLYRYNPKHLYPKLNGYGDNGQRILKL